MQTIFKQISTFQCFPLPGPFLLLSLLFFALNGAFFHVYRLSFELLITESQNASFGFF